MTKTEREETKHLVDKASEVIIIIIIMVIFKFYFSGEHIALSYKKTTTMM